MPRGPGKKENYNLDYSRWGKFDKDRAEEQQDHASESELREMLKRIPPELQEAQRLMALSVENSDPAAKERAKELAMSAIKKAPPEVQKAFLENVAAQQQKLQPQPEADASSPAAMAEKIVALRQQLEEGAGSTRKQLESLQQQQEQLESLRSPDDILNFLRGQGFGQEDVQRIFNGDQAHIESCVQNLLQKTGDANPEMEEAIAAADTLHTRLCNPDGAASTAGAPSEEGGGLPAIAAATADSGAAGAAERRPQQQQRQEVPAVKIPEHRLQYHKDEAGQYTSVELKCTLPGVRDISLIALDVSEKYVRLSTAAPCPLYAVNAGPFPVLIEPEAARAKFSKRREELSIAVPAKLS